MTSNYLFKPKSSLSAMHAAISIRHERLAWEAKDFLDESRWQQSRQRKTSHIRTTFAVRWLLEGFSLSGEPPAKATLDFLLDQSHRSPLTQQGQAEDEVSLHNRVQYIVAMAILDWWAERSPPCESLRAISKEYEVWLFKKGGRDTVVGEAKRTGRGWQRTLFIQFSTEAVSLAVSGQWSSLCAMRSAGFGFVDEMKQPSPDGKLIGFCFQLAEVCGGSVRESSHYDRCASMLDACCQSWIDSIRSGEPWDSSLMLLYLCVYAYERALLQQSPRLTHVGNAIRGVE